MGNPRWFLAVDTNGTTIPLRSDGTGAWTPKKDRPVPPGFPGTNGRNGYRVLAMLHGAAEQCLERADLLTEVGGMSRDFAEVNIPALTHACVEAGRALGANPARK